MRKIFCLILILFLVFLIPLTVFAHPGRTDGSGGHTNNSTGEYHYHHGYGAHQHTDMDGDGVPDCPYDFDDQTGSRSGSSSQTHVQSSTSVSRNPTESSTKVYVKEEPFEVMPTWVYIVFSVVVVVIFAMYMTCKGKDDQISDLTMEIHRIRSDADYNRKRAAEDLNAQSANFRECIAKLDSELRNTIGDDYIYKISGAPEGDYIGSDELPSSQETGDDRWGSKYTFYFASPLTKSRNYHRSSCRYADRRCPVNALSIRTSRNEYYPCNVCKPNIPDTDWVLKFRENSEIFERFGITVERENVPFSSVIPFEDSSYKRPPCIPSYNRTDCDR